MPILTFVCHLYLRRLSPHETEQSCCEYANYLDVEIGVATIELSEQCHRTDPDGFLGSYASAATDMVVRGVKLLAGGQHARASIADLAIHKPRQPRGHQT
ncbi:hypothetical protein [Tardiphaga sp. 42S5]|uniref:hypothetical protein n=1 Tax=Tardiphaga sp. 42S5 TaxID=1404799 RepID=UPI002A5ADD7D|nr:hypothetical protein [Tardiphaga sp. 42S5]WPO40326.1 hypothetical protein SFY93_22700 [Tardiphaga sp. 42S5]